MKKLMMIFGILAMAFTAFTQQDEEYNTRDSDEIQTLMGKNNALGGYGAISMQYTEIQDRDAFVFGARGGITMGHTVTLGIGGAGFFNDMHYDETAGYDISLAGGYGGFFFEPVVFPKYPVHVSFPILIGAGGVAVVRDNDDDTWDDDFESEASDAFMVIEPGVEVELNITRFFKFCVGAYYRYTSDVDIDEGDYNIPNDILHGFSGGVTFKFGKF
ncbi:MAG: hypothetical protein JXA72_04275 [Bacteroidales bacterium]|nr:hypothetical protein [Bacteroidales bacterium]